MRISTRLILALQLHSCKSQASIFYENLCQNLLEIVKNYIDAIGLCATMTDMKRLIRTIGLAGLGLLAVANAYALQWQTKPDVALDKAAADGRTVLMEFTGSDWCPPCIHLRTKVFPTPEFESYAGEKNLVLIELDFPRDARKLTREQAAINESWRAKYDINSFPTILLLDGDGAPYVQLTGAAPNVEGYLSRLSAAMEKKASIEASLAAARQLSGIERARALAAVLDELPAAWRTLHRSALEDIIAHDAEDTLGYKRLITENQMMAAQKKELEALYDRHRGNTDISTMDAAVADAQKMLEREDLLPEIRLHLNKFLCDTYAMHGDLANTHKYMKAAIDAAPDSKAAAHLRPWLENLEKHMNEKSAE